MKMIKAMVNSFIKWIYNSTIRSHLPKKIATLNGVAVRHVALFDATDVQPKYKEELTKRVRRNVEPGDNVVIIGGGRGVTTVAASKLTDSVIVYEAAEKQVELIKETVEINAVKESVDIRHGVVGEARDIWGSIGGGKHYSPDELPECDLLEMDCEGAERKILPNLDIRPKYIIVEAHGCFGSPPEWVREQLENMGYVIISEKLTREKDDVAVLVAKLEKN